MYMDYWPVKYGPLKLVTTNNTRRIIYDMDCAVDSPSTDLWIFGRVKHGRGLLGMLFHGRVMFGLDHFLT